MVLFTFQDLFNTFKPIIQFLSGAWEWFNRGVWDAYIDVLEMLEFGGVNIFATFTGWIADVFANITNLDEWLNQYTMLTFSLGSGILIVIVITIIGWVGDKVGL